MARGSMPVRAIQEAISRLENERAAFNARIDGRIEGLREALRLQANPHQVAEPELRKRARRGDLKDKVLEIVTQAGQAGVIADEVVSSAKEKGVTLVPSSVSSSLSRLKNDQVLFFDGERYRLAQYKGPKQVA